MTRQRPHRTDQFVRFRFEILVEHRLGNDVRKNTGAYCRSNRTEQFDGRFRCGSVSRRVQQKISSGRYAFIGSCFRTRFEPLEEICRIAVDDLWNIPKRRFDIFDRSQHSIRWGAARTQRLRHPGSNVKAALNVFVNSRVDHSPEFFVLKGGMVFFNESPEFVEKEVFALHAVVEVLKWIFQCIRNLTSAFGGSTVSMRTFTVCPGSSLLPADSLERR